MPFIIHSAIEDGGGKRKKNPNVQLFAEYVSNLYLSKEEKAFFGIFTLLFNKRDKLLSKDSPICSLD